MYYEDYITDRAATAFDYEKASFTHYDVNNDEVDDSLDEPLNKQMFKGVMREMVAYLYDRRNEIDTTGDLDLLFDAENVEKIYVTARGLETPTVVVEYDDLPDWFEMENAQLREFYWHPDPGLSGEWSAAYFQPR